MYPANLLRNVGRNYSSTPFHIVLDADVIPSRNLFNGLQELIFNLPARGRELEWVGLIVPVFETDSFHCCVPECLPLTKKDLLEQIARDKYGKFLPFYSQLNHRVQGGTNYKKWYRLPLAYNYSISVAYRAEWTDPYEPFLVLHKSAPLFDSRFVQYGVNRLSNICELHMAGWEFFVLDNAFLIHCGLKLKQGFHKQKTEELTRNQLFYKTEFLNDLMSKYEYTYNG